jgi:hypothetical protein
MTTWEVAYRVVSADGHAISGSVNFVAPAGGEASTSSSNSATAPAAGPDTEPGDGGLVDPAGEDAGGDGSTPPWGILTLAVLALAVLLAAGVLLVRSGRNLRRRP